ncbi:MAG TPA: hypothetical protein VFI48_11870 [Hyphomicrobiaceae bacterium]|nr:hypothetical protein [Hyphomicrobiaceae bacterium]
MYAKAPVLRAMVTHARLAALITSACIVAACSSQQPYQQLPDVARLPERLLNKDEQQARIVDMTAKQRAKETQAEKEIEETK